MATKYNYILVIQQNYGYGQGWEDVSEYEANSQGTAKEYDTKELTNGKTGRKYFEKLITHDAREYRLTGYATRIIFRKEKKVIETELQPA